MVFVPREPTISVPINVEAEKSDHPASEPHNLTPIISTYRNSIVAEYLRKAAPSFRYLEELRTKGWENPAGDEYYKNQRFIADNAGPRDQKRFFSMMRSIGREMDAATGAFSCPHPNALDLCMAPGGFTVSILDRHPDANIKGISLPRSLGGHSLQVSHGRMDPRVEVQFMDLTMLAGEFGVRLDDIPPQHPEAEQFSSARPYKGKKFNLVICDGQVLRGHSRAKWRESCEATRLTVSQLILGLQRIKTGGTFIMLLHKFEAWNTCTLLRSFNNFSLVFLFKPVQKHAQRSSFYLVAKDVQPESRSAKETVKEWKKIWYMTTFGSDTGGGSVQEDLGSEEVVAAFLQDFGPRLVELGDKIWKTQARALEMAPYIKQSHSNPTTGIGGTGLHLLDSMAHRYPREKKIEAGESPPVPDHASGNRGG